VTVNCKVGPRGKRQIHRRHKSSRPPIALNSFGVAPLHCSDGEPEREQVGLPGSRRQRLRELAPAWQPVPARAIFAGVNQAAAVADLRGAGVRVQRPAVEIAGLKTAVGHDALAMLKVNGRLCKILFLLLRSVTVAL